ncbi:MAG: hypothetical protein U9M95_04520 [Candidatus Altiarchaeota archaeon]|nr:hypothetical protein [Candidatus Altiarchaeota archaeon]
MDPNKIRNILKSWRIIFLVFIVVVSLLLVMNIIPVNSGKGIGVGNGLDYGLDFAGGVQMQLKLEREVDKDTMEIEKGILLSRLNAMGLKDISVRPWGNQYILVQISDASPTERERIERILKQPARFEQLIDGELGVNGDEIEVDSDPRSSGVFEGQQGGYGWRVGVKITGEGAHRFGKVAFGKYFGENSPMNRPVDLFIDRPSESVIVMKSGEYHILANLTSSADTGSIYYGDTALQIMEERSNLTVIPWSLNDSLFLPAVMNYSNRYDRVIIAGDDYEIPEKVRAEIEELGFVTERRPKGNNTYEGWVKEITGLMTSPRLNFNTRGEPVYGAVITGWTPTLEDSVEELKQNKIWLSSGNLPAKAEIESQSEVPASLGGQFLEGSFIIGVIAILTVAVIVYLRYRKLFIVGPLMFTGLSEIMIILGLASVINWELDLAAVAGIIAAVGTGVDDQILITDETLRRDERRKIVSVTEQIRRAFFIIFTAAATTIAVMLPVFTIQALQGFAFTTVAGVLIGVFITRRGYAKIIEELIS